jgi:class 3 adenylate cyclase
VQQLLAMARSGDEAGLRALLHNKIVLLGTVFDDADQLNVPLPLAQWRPQALHVPGVLVHAQILRNLLGRGLVHPVSTSLYWVACLAASLFWLRSTVLHKLILLAVLTISLLACSTLLLSHLVWLAPGGPLLCAWLAFSARSGWEGWRHFRDKQRLHRNFSGYVSPSVLDNILAGKLDPARQGKKQAICVLFSDLRDFTPLAESMAPERVVEILNRYFARMTEAVHEHGGTVDKFLGDGMMAFFGAPNPLPHPQQSAFDAARAMMQALEALNREFAKEGLPILQLGVGLHCGVAVIGHIGSPQRHEYTAIGDTVNTASRLQDLCRDLGHPILCSEAVALSLQSADGLIQCGEQAIKGHSAIKVFAYRT